MRKELPHHDLICLQLEIKIQNNSFLNKCVFRRSLSIKTCFLNVTFFCKKCKNISFMVKKGKQKFCSKSVNVFLERKKMFKAYFCWKDYPGPFWVRAWFISVNVDDFFNQW